jgi:alcohol/geraniol dehydrogenase (NADP+)
MNRVEKKKERNMTKVRAWAAKSAGAKLERYEYDPGPIGREDVDIAVESCGICHSDLSCVNNEWGITRYPIVPGHEVVGRVVALGADARGLKIGDRVGVGWYAGSCMSCDCCVGGEHHLCAGAQATIVGHHGGFAERTRVHWTWAIPIPEGLDAASAGPLLCGGMTVVSPLMRMGITPMHKVGVVGIGGLGHMAVMFARAWGCEVVAFTSSPGKRDEAIALGAHRAVSSRDAKELAVLAGQLDALIVTVNASMDWPALLNTLAPKGRMHVVGAVLEPMAIPAFSLIVGEKQVSGSPTGSPQMLREMLRFAARHQIKPVVERFPMSKVNDAMAHLAAGRARFRIVLDADH